MILEQFTGFCFGLSFQWRVVLWNLCAVCSTNMTRGGIFSSGRSCIKTSWLSLFEGIPRPCHFDRRIRTSACGRSCRWTVRSRVPFQSSSLQSSFYCFNCCSVHNWKVLMLKFGWEFISGIRESTYGDVLVFIIIPIFIVLFSGWVGVGFKSFFFGSLLF